MKYRTELVEGFGVSNVTEKIDEKINKMLTQGFALVSFSFLGTQRAVLVFKEM